MEEAGANLVEFLGKVQYHHEAKDQVAEQLSQMAFTLQISRTAQNA